MLNGSPLQSYNHAYLRAGHVEAPVAPYLTRVADRITYAGEVMIIRRGISEVRIRTGSGDPKSLQALYVPVAPILRALGAQVSFDKQAGVLEIHIRASQLIQTMSPYPRDAPGMRPSRVFTPEPVQTPRPLYTGSPHPRRTPIVRETSRPA